MLPCQKEILKRKIEDIKKVTFEMWEESPDRQGVYGDVIDEEFSDRQNSLQFKMKSREIFFIKKIENTIKRMEKDDYGNCLECGNEISFKRLLARPMAEKCISCKEVEERQEGNILYEKKSHTLGKSITNSAKSNVVYLGSKSDNEQNVVRKFELLVN